MLHIFRDFSSAGASPEQANADGVKDERSSRLIAGAKERICASFATNSAQEHNLCTVQSAEAVYKC
ncbi:hypothetical protein D9754_15780 [Planomicrobium sp. Y74]|nr:hypothetical protein D9754_15780 [Planomicrobium sp. Y74]